jgi:nicotinate-nucleotide pyrophosphorylase (carboxylating)
MPFDSHQSDSSSDFWRTADLLIDLALAEDLGDAGDITTQAIAARAGETSPSQARAEIIAKSAGVVAGIEIVRRVFQKAQPPILIEASAPDGESIAPKTTVTRLRGPANGILTYERTALNFLQRLSGIATLTRKFVDTIAGTHAVILDTRKTTPGWRRLEKYAVRCGGGTNHRSGLHDMFLIKENHLAAAGSITAAVQKCREYLRAQRRELKIEVETKNLAEVEECLLLGIDRIMLTTCLSRTSAKRLPWPREGFLWRLPAMLTSKLCARWPKPASTSSPSAL